MSMTLTRLSALVSMEFSSLRFGTVPPPMIKRGPKRTLQYIIAIFLDFFKGLSQKNEKNMTFFLRKSPPRSVHFCENKNF